MTWITTEKAAELMGVSRRWVAKLISADLIASRAGAPAANGKPSRQILLESLKPECQEKYFRALQREAEGAAIEFLPDSQVVGLGQPTLAQTSANAEANSSAGSSLIPSRLAGKTMSPAGSLILSEPKLAAANELHEALQSVRDAENKTSAKEAVARAYGRTIRWVEMRIRREDKLGVRGLARTKRKDAGKPRGLPLEWKAIAAAAYLKKRTPNFKKAYRDFEKECILKGVEPCSYETFARWVKQELPPATIAYKKSLKKYREDWRVAYEPCVRREHHDTIRDIVDGDWHRMDIFVRDDEGVNRGKPYRPFLCAIGDCCSGEVMGIHLQPVGNALGIGLALRHAIQIKRHPSTREIDDRVPQACAGWFKEFYTDNGRDFISAYIKTFMHDLGGRTRQAEGFHGQSKPLERLFKTLTEDLISELPGFCGRSPLHKPHDSKPTLTRRELFVKVYEWIFYEYHNRPSRALRKLSPYGVLAEHVANVGFKPVIPDDKTLDFLLMPSREATVRKWGIELFGTGDRRNLYQSDMFAVRQLIGEKVVAKYDPDDLGTLFIFHNGKFMGPVYQERRRGYREKDLRDLYHRRKLARQAVANTIKEKLAAAQYGDGIERSKAERVYAELEAQELRDVAEGASRGSIRAIVPRYASAAKQLAAAPTVKREREKPRPIDDEDLKISDELFKRERNPWLDGNEYERSGAELSRREKNPWLSEDDE